MTFRDSLAQRSDAIAESWWRRIIESYPAKSASFFGKQKDPFANPVGQTIVEASREIVAGICAGVDPRELRAPVERIVKIRAVQDFTPAEAVSFVFQLKPIVRADEALSAGADEMLAFEASIDRLALVAFECYVACREQICELRVNEIKRTVSTLMRRAARAGWGDGDAVAPDDEN